ncbi:unnamed protein product [Tetraodon nigroviridis]|uniref:(spotted green pufferfish) hypothetical protein n=1 Tax=Tetraodon nigroviridis TaxID=99883 RepID=Q4SJL9_TETNG|nr:unnamed protein product [Tetraodon nigroviridis]
MDILKGKPEHNPSLVLSSASPPRSAQGTQLSIMSTDFPRRCQTPMNGPAAEAQLINQTLTRETQHVDTGAVPARSRCVSDELATP